MLSHSILYLVPIVLIILMYIGIKSGYLLKVPIEVNRSQRAAYALIIGSIISISGGYFILLGIVFSLFIYLSKQQLYKISIGKY